MKVIKNLLFGFSVLGLLLIMSCSDDPSPEQEAINRLAKTWGNATVQLDGSDVTSPSYDNFSITFRTDGSYITSDGDPVFKPGGGFWAYTDQTNFSRIDVDGVSMNVALNTNATTLTLSFTAPGSAIGARVEGLEGDYVFNLAAQ
jgi:hypothetical protein